jgi:hypothetical protein
MAKDIVVSVRPQDRSLAEGAISQAIDQFKKEAKINCTHTINEDLPKDSSVLLQIYYGPYHPPFIFVLMLCFFFFFNESLTGKEAWLSGASIRASRWTTRLTSGCDY